MFSIPTSCVVTSLATGQPFTDTCHTSLHKPLYAPDCRMTGRHLARVPIPNPLRPPFPPGRSVVIMSGMSIPRKHHFIPKFYLAGFTASGRDDDKLFVHDKSTGRVWQSSLADAGSEKDFYMLELDDEGDPAAVEKLLSMVEASGSNAIRFLAAQERVPDGHILADMATFFGALAVRTPHIFGAIDNWWEQICKALAWYQTESRESWAAVVQEAGKKDMVIKTSWEDMKSFVQSGEYEITLDQNTKMRLLLTMLPVAAAIMAGRRWSLSRVADHESPSLICSDRPIWVSWIEPERMGCLPPAIGAPGTRLVIPVSRRLLLWGTYEEPLPTTDLDSVDVGTFNLVTAVAANRFVYSGTLDFPVTFPDGSAGGWQQVLDYIKSNSEKSGDEEGLRGLF